MNKAENSHKPYLVTGAAGFIGARFVESCNRRAIPVISVDHAEYFTARAEHRGVDFGTVVDRERLSTWLAENDPTLAGIVHLGACTNTMELREDYLTRMNLEYSKTLWNYATHRKLPFVYASSAATYGDGSEGYDDDETRMSRLKPLNPYGDSKLKFDLWALDEERKGNHPPSWSGFKFFNVFGFGERHKNAMASVVFKAFEQIRSKGSLQLFRSHRAGIADGQQKRDFVFVEDVVSVLHFALEKPIPRGIYNLGTGQARSYLDLGRAVFAALGQPEKIDFVDTPVELRERYQYFTEAKMEKLRSQGYTQPFTSLEDAIAKYVAQLRNFYP